jgi:cell shape-determining protein MreD
VEFLISLPVFVICIMLQTTSISRLPLIHGTADLSLLTLIAWGIHSRSNWSWVIAVLAGFIFQLFSQVHWWAVIIPYLLILLMTRQLHGKFWNSPILAMLLMTIIGSLMVHIATTINLFLLEIPFNFSQAFTEIMLPSIFLNLILALPVYFLIKDLLRNYNSRVENE